MRVSRLIVVVAAVATLLAAGSRTNRAHAQTRPDTRATMLSVTGGNELRSWDNTVNSMLRAGTLRLRREDPDPLVPGRTHERLDQYHRGVRIFGADMTRQFSAGSTVSMFGVLYLDIDIDVAPVLDVDAALGVIRRDSGAELGRTRLPELVIFPDEDTYRLVYHAKAFSRAGGFEYFIDATNGAIVRKLDAMQRQTSAVGTGTGVLGDAKKMSTASLTGTFIASDFLRPPFLVTFDMRENLNRMMQILNGVVGPSTSDIASDGNNTWTDAAVVDAHAYAGYTYDYYYKRFNRRGLDNADLEMWGFVHPVPRAGAATASIDVLSDFYANAFYAGDGVVVYGEGLPFTLFGQRWDFLAGGIDVVGHELTHGVTDFSSRLIYQLESGALNESFSDMMGTAIEFFFQPAGNGPLRADYLAGEDVVTPGGIRSLANPAAYGDPDHYSRRFISPNPPGESNDNGGVHINSGIPNQFYFLAIEGGVNRTSGLSVTGVGTANREQIERVVYRAFTQLLPANATFSIARAATIQAARDLFPTNAAVLNAVTQAWNAVGVN